VRSRHIQAATSEVVSSATSAPTCLASTPPGQREGRHNRRQAWGGGGGESRAGQAGTAKFHLTVQPWRGAR
jgi:hypothetical protein